MNAIEKQLQLQPNRRIHHDNCDRLSFIYLVYNNDSF